MRTLSALFLSVIILAGCKESWNNPYPDDKGNENTLYAVFIQRPKHLDPVQSYTEDESLFLYQIVEPPLQYHYLKRPHELIPATAVSVPVAQYFDAKGKPLSLDTDPDQVAYSIYEIQIKPGIYYQPHPAFAKNEDESYVYYPMTLSDVQNKFSLFDFTKTGTKELIAADYIYQIKRLAHPRLHSPLLEQMGNYIIGLKEYAQGLQKAAEKLPAGAWLDLDQYDFEGVKLIDRYTYQIKIKGTYPQMTYWLSLHFFSPVPREVDRFFSQPGMSENNITLDWYPMGTGPFMLVENNPNRRMVLARNPNFRDEFYPSEGEPEDVSAGLLKDAGLKLPFINRIVFTREKESIPYWNKFLQGYYDASGVSSTSFDQVIQINSEGDASLSEEMCEKGIRLLTAIDTSTFYMGFNMLDPVIGGYTESQKKLRLAISIAYNQEEYNSIFLNGRAISAQSPIPPGIFGYRTGKEGMNPLVFDWVNDQPKRKSIEVAKRLLAEAGYPNGRHVKTGEPLVLSLDTTGRGVADKSRLDWTIKQFAKLNIQLNIRSSDFNRFQDKLRSGNFQIYELGWNTDYPDPENMFFLFDSAQGRVKTQGENTSNYKNSRFDALFHRMKNMQNGSERQALIDQMIDILRKDAPWSFGLHLKSYILVQPWISNRKAGSIIPNTLKYQRLDAVMRAELRTARNQPAILPLVIFSVCLITLLILGWRFFSIRGNTKPLASDNMLPYAPIKDRP